MKKFLAVLTLVMALLVMTTGAAFAQDTTPITGTIQAVEVQTDAVTGETVVVVTLLDPATNTTQTVNLSLENAASLGLVNTDPVTGAPVPNETLYNTEISIDPALIQTPEEETEAEHPVGSALGEFFGELLGVDYDAVMEAHDEGFGFGVIAQALWLTNQIDGDAETFTALLEAKQSGDYSAITLADGSTPDNWGDVVKSLKKGENLGSVKSGKADAETEQNGKGKPTTENSADNGNNGQGNGNGKGNNGNNGKGNGNDKGGGKGKP